MNLTWPDYIESNCRQNYSFFCTTDYLRNAYHCTALISVTLSLFTFYAIIRVTPPRLKNMKTPLLITHAWSTNLDLMLTVYSAPMVFFPSASGIPLGIFGSLGIPVKWQAYWGQVSIFCMGLCFVMLYENRQSQIPTIKFKMKTKRVRQIYFGINYIMAFTIMLPFYLEDSNQIELRQYRIPCPAIEFFDPKTYVLLKGGEIVPFISITISLVLVIFQTLFFLLHTICHLTMITNSNISDATKSLQRKLLGYVSVQASKVNSKEIRSIDFQISIPLIAITGPILYSLYADQNNYYNQAYNNNSMLLMAFHGILSTTCTLLIYQPYRDLIKHIIFGKKEDEDRRTSMATASYIGKGRRSTGTRIVPPVETSI
ncbi:hypothetical protein CRE_18538 [Caenorhabditis remanei]|uniref:Serpentine Receptor, class H n=1 Tax=Caenorhabditis remanei TaxID=31234 RepID=E3LLG3_CAERE|nr:hypothetical protein CRE_18538 [Caenorhabditis remanei]